MRIIRPRFTSVTHLGFVGAALILVGCAPSVRLGPVIDADAPAPFTTASGPTPTQAEAQTAVDAAVHRDGVSSVFPQFGRLAQVGVPASITLFGCSPDRGDAKRRKRSPMRVSATCTVDVLDQGGGLVGRATMEFAHEQGNWILTTAQEREFDAR